ncbi:cuticlin-4-like [Artemia franciscana]|uniref:cuticlin-4-like n=1 Tax=Artemia franciscana TaxID=6661 RepID=UPI0032DB785D
MMPLKLITFVLFISITGGNEIRRSPKEDEFRSTTRHPGILVNGVETTTIATVAIQNDIGSSDSTIQDLKVDCTANEMIVRLITNGPFHGMVYPKGLTQHSSCLADFDELTPEPLVYRLPLRSCNTMFVDVEDGIEYHNIIVIQPHKKIVTNQGRDYQIRCRYQTRDRNVLSDFRFNLSVIGTPAPDSVTAIPPSTMRIFLGNPDEDFVAEKVKIGDPLTLVVALEEQDVYGMKITDCSVKDGIGWGEQMLYNSQGCPVDPEIMGPLIYSRSKTIAKVNFQAHKFPYTPSVYYQCQVSICKRKHGCEDVPPICDVAGNNLRRKRRIQRNTQEDFIVPQYYVGDSKFAQNATIEVFGGFYVTDTTDSRSSNPLGTEERDSPEIVRDPDTLCISPRHFAIGIAIAGLILIFAVIAVILILVSRRRRRKAISTTGSSIYSGQYSNTAYSSHSS